MAAIERGKAEGGTVAVGGERGDDEAYLIAPTVFENVADDAFLSCEEVFGPVTSLYRFSTLDEALARANAVEFGLSAAIFTRDLHATQRFANELQAGILHVNSQTAGADVHVPFGGLKGSGWGPHEQGRAAREFYTETVTVYQDAPLGWSGAVARHGRPRLPRSLGRELRARGRRRDRRLRPRGRPQPARARARRRRRTGSRSCTATSPTSRRSSTTLDEHEITRVVHLAALQVPFVRANPPLGMQVNVAGTVNVFDAVSRRLGRIPNVTYASSTAVYSASDPSPAPESGGCRPGTLYGVSKLADEGMARVYRGRARRAVDRAAAVRRLRPGPRPGHDLGADGRHARGSPR